MRAATFLAGEKCYLHKLIRHCASEKRRDALENSALLKIRTAAVGGLADVGVHFRKVDLDVLWRRCHSFSWIKMSGGAYSAGISSFAKDNKKTDGWDGDWDKLSGGLG